MINLMCLTLKVNNKEQCNSSNFNIISIGLLLDVINKCN